MRFGRRLGLLIIAVLLAVPAAVLACGMPLEATVPQESALISLQNGREEIVARLTLEGAGPKSAVVFPVPGDADVSAVDGPDPLVYLATATAPPPVESGGSKDEATAAAPPRGGGVQVEGRETVGGYDVTRLRADDPNALTKWLGENGYPVPDGAAPIIASYVRDKWKFVAIKLAKVKGEVTAAQDLKPLKIGFKSQQIVYPKRLDQIAKQVPNGTYYIVADRQVAREGLGVDYAGPVAGLTPAPPASVKPLLRGRWITRLSTNGVPSVNDVKTDWTFTPVSDKPFGQPNDKHDGGLSSGSIIVLIVFGVTILGGMALGLRRRRGRTRPL